MTRHYTHIGDLAASQAVAALPVLSFTCSEPVEPVEGPALGESGKSGKEARPPESTIPKLSAILPELQRMNAKNWRKIRDDLMKTLKPKKKR